jgi:hypothetical protein
MGCIFFLLSDDGCVQVFSAVLDKTGRPSCGSCNSFVLETVLGGFMQRAPLLGQTIAEFWETSLPLVAYEEGSSFAWQSMWTYMYLNNEKRLHFIQNEILIHLCIEKLHTTFI